MKNSNRAPPQQQERWDRDKFLRRVVALIRRRHLSTRTEKTYVRWIRRYLSYHGSKDPVAMASPEIDQFLSHLADELGLGADSQNQAASSIAFLYRELYGWDLAAREGITRAKEPHVLPKYAPPEEVDRFMAELHGLPLLASTIIYGAGPRVSEVVAIRVKDLNLTNRELMIRSGKGNKDRITVLPTAAISSIRDQIEAVADQHALDLEADHGWAYLPGALHRKDPEAGWDLAWQFLFPSTKITEDKKTKRRGRRPIHITSIQRPIKNAWRRSGVHSPITAHVLRHCFATELARSGCDMRTLQQLMGHNDIRTTMRYLHFLDRPGLNIESPFDRLPSQQKNRLETELLDG